MDGATCFEILYVAIPQAVKGNSVKSHKGVNVLSAQSKRAVIMPNSYAALDVWGFFDHSCFTGRQDFQSLTLFVKPRGSTIKLLVSEAWWKPVPLLLCHGAFGLIRLRVPLLMTPLCVVVLRLFTSKSTPHAKPHANTVPPDDSSPTQPQALKTD